MRVYNNKAIICVIATACILPLAAFFMSIGLRIIYWDVLRLPIGLGGGLFFLTVIPWAILFSIIYSIAAYILFSRRAASFHCGKVLLVGVAIGFVALAIFFPCEKGDTKFMGSYFLDSILED